MTLTELIAQYRSASRDTALPYFNTDADLLLLFRDAEREACERKDLIFDDSTADVCNIDVTTDDGSTYDLHQTVNRINKAYLVDDGGTYFYLTIVSRDELDRIKPTWREDDGDPEYIIVDEKKVTIVPAVADDYTMHLEVYRSPLDTELLQLTPTSPTIAVAHHRKLYHWVMYKTHGMQDDTDTYNPVRAAKHFKDFEDYFGMHPGANRRRKTREDIPHRNKVW